MADVFTSDNSSVGVAAPILPGGYYPSIDRPSINGLGLRVPWGGGSMAKIQTSPVGGMTVAPQDDVSRLLTLLSINMPTGNVINYNFEGLVGPAGPSGPPGLSGTVEYIGPDIDLGGAALSSDVPETSGIVFTQSGSNVVWTTGTLRYKGINYTIAAEATGDTNAYIYWDKDTTPTTLLTTATLATAVGADKWIMCYNASGVPHPAAMNKVIHGGLIQASTVTATQISVANLAAINADLGTVTAGDVSACTLDVETADIVNLNVTTAKIANLNATTEKIANDATTLVESAYTAGTYVPPAGAYRTLQSDSITSVGGTVEITCTAKIAHSIPPQTIAVRILRGATPIRTFDYVVDSDWDLGEWEDYQTPVVMDSPGAGSYTYYFQVQPPVNDCHTKERFVYLKEYKK